MSDDHLKAVKYEFMPFRFVKGNAGALQECLDLGPLVISSAAATGAVTSSATLASSLASFLKSLPNTFVRSERKS